MSSFAVCSRILEFRAGPQNYEFHACQEHRKKLEDGTVDLFFPTEDNPVLEVNVDQEIDCDFCREG